jgi:hypothetical protein
MPNENWPVKPMDPFADLVTGFPEVGPTQRKSHRAGSAKFLHSKLPWAWLTHADALGGSALAVGLIVHRNRAINAPFGWPNRVGLESGEPLGLGRKAVRLGLARLAEAGLIRIEANAGRKAIVTILDVPTPEGRPQFIFPKIPLDWIGQAARTASPGLLVGLAAWRYDHMTDIPGESRFSIAPLQSSPRSTSALTRGLAALEKAGLIERLPAPRGFARVRVVKAC